MRAHILDENNVITNTIIVESLDSLPGFTLVDAEIGGVVGDKIVDGAVQVVLPDLEPLKAAAIAATYEDVDAVYADAVGNRTEEYKDAETDSRAFAAAGYSGTVSAYISSYAQHNPTGTVQTNQWAADQIIARADAFNSAKTDMRTNRFILQASMRNAATLEDLNAAKAQWNGFISSLRAQLGL